MNKDELKNYYNNKDLGEYDNKYSFYKHMISKLKDELSQSDYKAIKYAEGLITEEEYEPIKLERQELRNQIHEYEQEIEKLGD